MSELTYVEETSLRGIDPDVQAQTAAALSQAFLDDNSEDSGDPVFAPEPVAAAPPRVPSRPAPAATAADEPPDETDPFNFDFEPQLSPDLAELLEDETPDFDAEARAEIAAETQTAEDQGVYTEYQDPEQQARVRALEKRNLFLENRLVETNRGKWLAENLRAYPLVAQYAKDDLTTINATSRRAFAREAAALNDRITRIAKPLHEDIQRRLLAGKNVALGQARSEVAASWGEPAVDPAGTGRSAANVEKIEKARKSEDLGAVLQAMIEADPVNSF